MKFSQSFCPPKVHFQHLKMCVWNKLLYEWVSVWLDGRIYRLRFVSEGPTRVLVLLLLVQTWVNRMRTETSQNFIWLWGKDQAHYSFTFIAHFNFNNIFKWFWLFPCSGPDAIYISSKVCGQYTFFDLGGNGNNLQ